MPQEPPAPSYPLADLCVLTDLPTRTIRYYVQIGLVDPGALYPESPFRICV